MAKIIHESAGKMTQLCRRIVHVKIKWSVLGRVSVFRQFFRFIWDRILACSVGRPSRYRRLSRRNSCPSVEAVELGLEPHDLAFSGYGSDSDSDLVALKISILGDCQIGKTSFVNQPALEKDRYKIRQAFVAAPGNSLIVADYGQLELRILAHLANCKSMLDAFKAGGDFHSRTAMNMYPHIREAVEQKSVLLEWHPQPGEDKRPVPLLKDAFASERRKAKMLNFSIAYGKTPVGLSRDWKVSVKEARETVARWYNERKEVRNWQDERKKEACSKKRCVHTLLGRARLFPSVDQVTSSQRGHIERAAINTPVQGSAADVAMCAMLEISKNLRLKELGWRLLLQVHDEVILEGPTESAEEAKAIVVECMSKPFDGKNILRVDLSIDAKCAQNWYSAK